MAEITEFHLNIKGPDLDQPIVLRTGITTIGRQQGNDVLLDNAQVSRSHARIECTLTECWLTDLGSANGTRADGIKLTPNVPVQLKDQSQVKIGPYELSIVAVPIAAPVSDEAQVPEATPDVSEPPTTLREEQPEGNPDGEKEPAGKSLVLDQVSKPKSSVERKAPAVQPVEVRADRGDGPDGSDGAGEQPPENPPPQATGVDGQPFGADGLFPPGLGIESRRLINYLPGIYATDFMSRFLGIFEAILSPIEWTVDNFDLFLDPGTSPAGFLVWLENWYGVAWKSAWSVEKRRTLLKEAHKIYARRGTSWALSRILEIYTGVKPDIIDDGANLEPFTFVVKIPLKRSQANQDVIQALIEANKPAYTTYRIEFGP